MNSYVFDTGEGTLGQIQRYLGQGIADKIIRNLRLVFISHIHADHHLGFFNLLNRWLEVRHSFPSRLI